MLFKFLIKILFFTLVFSSTRKPVFSYCTKSDRVGPCSAVSNTIGVTQDLKYSKFTGKCDACHHKEVQKTIDLNSCYQASGWETLDCSKYQGGKICAYIEGEKALTELENECYYCKVFKGDEFFTAECPKLNGYYSPDRNQNNFENVSS